MAHFLLCASHSPENVTGILVLRAAVLTIYAETPAFGCFYIFPAHSPRPPPDPLPTSAPSPFLYLISVFKYACVHEEYIEWFAYSWF